MKLMWIFGIVAMILSGAWVAADWMAERNTAVPDDQVVETPQTEPAESGVSNPETATQAEPDDSSATDGQTGVQPEPAEEVDGATKAEGEADGATTEPPVSQEDGQAGAGVSGEVHISFVGDVLFGGKVAPLLEQHGYDYPYRKVADLLKSPDLTIGNLETPITTRGEPEFKEWAYRSSPLTLPELKEAGFDLMNLANNHIGDYGKIGLLDTLDYMKEHEIDYVGAGRSADEAYRPVYLERQGIKIAFLGFSRVVPNVDWKARNPSESEPDGNAGVAETYDYRKPVEAIKTAREQADLVIVIAHWGEERKDTPLDYQVELAHRYIDAGADLIVGSHPHVLQSFDNYKGKWIAYSLGNFIFTTNEVEKTRDSLIMQAVCGKTGDCQVKLVPIHTVWAQPKVMEEEQGKALMKRLDEVSIRTHIDAEGKLHVREN